jgi:hypothetical protein
MRNVYKILAGKIEGRKLFGRPIIEWGIILKCIFGKYYLGVRAGFIWFRIGTGNALLYAWQ